MKIIFIVPYYGNMPSYFKLFLQTCKNNSRYDWIFFSENNGKYDYPDNVRYVEMSWEKLRNLFQKKFEFPISLDSPYKLCDFRPAYGYIFEEYIGKYDYWGHCDIDLLFGDLDAFLTGEKIREFDKVGHLGHMTLYKNDKVINKLFMSEINGLFRYKEVFESIHACVFDEWNRVSINHIFLEKKKKVWLFEEFLDIYPYDDNLKKVIRIIPTEKESYGKDIIEKQSSFVSLEEGKIYQWKFERQIWKRKEVAYVHFQKRNMLMELNDLSGKILCVPDKFVVFDGKDIPRQYIRKQKIHKFLNKKKYELKVRKMKYWLIEKSSPVRHALQKRRNFDVCFLWTWWK